MPVLVLYDTPADVPSAWAPNVWLVRLVLNRKRIEHITEWVELADLESKMRNVGAQPTPGRDGRPSYKLPVLIVQSRSGGRPLILSDTGNIVDYLEEKYPTRPIIPDGTRALQSLFVHYVQDVFVRPLLPIMIPLSHQRLSERNRAHFFPNTSIPQPIPAGPQREQAWEEVRNKFRFLASILDKNSRPEGDGEVTSGVELTYADFAICSILIWIETVSPREGWPRVRQWDNGRWYRLRERCKDLMDVRSG